MISPPSPRQTTFIRIIAFEYHSHSRIGEKEKKKKKEKKEEEGVALTTREEIVSSSNWMHSQNELRGALILFPRKHPNFLSPRLRSNSFFLSPLLRRSLLNTSPLLIERLHGPPRLADSFPFQA